MGEWVFYFYPPRPAQKKAKKPNGYGHFSLRSSIQPIAADANRNTDENMSLNVSKSQW